MLLSRCWTVVEMAVDEDSVWNRNEETGNGYDDA
jgi:hypothetical protein